MAIALDKQKVLDTGRYMRLVGPTATGNADKAHVRLCIAHRTRPRVRRTSKAFSSTESSEQQVEGLLKVADALMNQLGSAASTTSASVNSASEEDNGEEPPSIMKLQCDVHGCTIVPTASDSAFYGPSGSFVGSSGQAVAEANRPRDFVLSEGEGWKLGYDKNPKTSNAYSAFVGGESWSIMMTQKEFMDFIQLLRKLQHSIATLQTCGEWGVSSEEQSNCGESAAGRMGDGQGRTCSLPSEASLELQTERIWVQARAPQKELFCLTDIFQRGGTKARDAKAAGFHLRFIINTPGQREVEGHYGPQVVLRLLEHLETYPPALEDAEGQPSMMNTQAITAGYIG